MNHPELGDLGKMILAVGVLVWVALNFLATHRELIKFLVGRWGPFPRVSSRNVRLRKEYKENVKLCHKHHHQCD